MLSNGIAGTRPNSPTVPGTEAKEQKCIFRQQSKVQVKVPQAHGTSQEPHLSLPEAGSESPTRGWVKEGHAGISVHLYFYLSSFHPSQDPHGASVSCLVLAPSPVEAQEDVNQHFSNFPHWATGQDPW